MAIPRGFPDTRPSLLRDLKDDGAESSWREFFDLYAPAVFRVGRLRGLDKHDAEDVVQQVMVSVLAHIGEFQYRRDRGQFRQWVRRIAENKITDFRRAQARKRIGAGSPIAVAGVVSREDASIDSLWEREWQRQDLKYCLELVEADISPRRMEAFRLYAVRGMSASETARRLGMTVGHVYVVRNLVLSLIRKRLSELRAAEEQSIEGLRIQRGHRSQMNGEDLP